MDSDVQHKLDTAVDTREKGNLHTSQELFKALLKEIKEKLQTDTSKEMKYTYATVMGEYIIQLRLEGAQKYNEALQEGRELLTFDEENDLQNPLSIRSVSNTLLNVGAFEEAEYYLNKLLILYKNKPENQGDTMAHLAYCMMRIGKITAASDLIEKALVLIKENSPSWYSYALMVKALILYAQNDKDGAITYAERAYHVANSSQVAARIVQADNLLTFLKNKTLANSSEVL
jgi:tetratricopeptide (TPR) repeat protein